MERPYCNICDTKHWRSEPHRFAKQASDTVSREMPETVKAEETLLGTASKEPRRPGQEMGAPGAVCPTCGHRRPMTSAERVRRHRARNRE